MEAVMTAAAVTATEMTAAMTAAVLTVVASTVPDLHEPVLDAGTSPKSAA